MSRFSRVIGRNKDLPQLESYSGAAASAGNGSDFEHIITTLTDLTYGASSGTAGDIVSNTMQVRYCMLTFETALTGANTNNCTFNFIQRRAGVTPVSTSSTTTITTGTAVVTPLNMTNIFSGQQLVFTGGTGATETVMIYNVTSSNFTANFANGHSGGYTITSAPLGSITFSSGMNATAFVPIQLPRVTNIIQRGDIVTIQRVSSNSTGLATPAYLACIDWTSYGVG